MGVDEVTDRNSTARQYRVRSLMLLPIVLLPLFLSLYSIHHYIGERGLGVSRQYSWLCSAVYVGAFLWIWNRRVRPRGTAIRSGFNRGALIGAVFGALFNVPRGIVVTIGSALRIAETNSSGYVSPIAVLTQALVFVISAIFTIGVGALTGALYGCVSSVIQALKTRRDSD